MAVAVLIRCGLVFVALAAPLASCEEQGAAPSTGTTPAKPESQPDTKPVPAPATPPAAPKGDQPQPKLEVVKVTIAGRAFNLELAADDQTRFKGLSDRSEIKPDGGMLFVFKEPKLQNFVMRDCLVPIDIIYLDASGRVTAMHKMPVEAPRAEDEKELRPPRDARGVEHPEMPKWTWTNPKYEERLKQFSSKYPAQFVIELKGNTLDSLKIKEGDKVELDRAGLKKKAK